jgi:hypothetical protein
MSNPARAYILSTTVLCSNFPEPIHEEVTRENILHTVESMLSSGDTEVAIVWGTEGIGKTTLLAQFARSRPNRCASLFIRSNTRFGYQPEHLLTDLTNQLACLSEGIEPQCIDFEERLLAKHIYQLQRKATRGNFKYIILVDGIDDIPAEDSLAVDIILSHLPLSYPQFRFVFSAHKTHLSIPRLTGLRQSALPLSPFGLSEARQFIGTYAAPSFVEELYAVTKGIPGDLATYKRMLNSGISESQLLAELPRTLSDKYQLEWRVVDASNSLQTKILAILALDRTAHTMGDLGFFLKASEKDIKAAIADLNFVETGTTVSSEVRYVSEAFRRFAAGTLSEWKETVNQLLIDALIAEPTSNRALYQLPKYLEDAQQHERLLSYLSKEHFAKMLEQSQSTTPLRQQAELGLRTAIKLKKDGDLVRFAVQESSILELDAFAISRSEVDARVTIGDDQAALSLASSAVLKQDRLRLLAAYCSAKQRVGRSVEQPIIDQIKTLLNEVDIRDLGSKAMELAVDLMRFLPDKAINVVERMAKTSNSHSLDLALARLSMTGIAAQEEQASALKVNCDVVRNQIKDPDLRNVSTAMAIAFGDLDSRQIIAEAERLEKPADKIYLLRQWASHTPDYRSAPEVLAYALRLVISASEYTPNATHLRQLATPLPYIDDLALASDFIGSFDAQKENTERLGPTEDYVWLQLLLAAAERKFSETKASDRLLEMYLYVERVADLTVRTACLGRLTSFAFRLDPNGELEEVRQLKILIQNDFDRCIEKLLSETASHDQVAKKVLIALAPNNPQIAIRVAESLNIEPRRDTAYSVIIDAYLDECGGNPDLLLIQDLVDRIGDSEEREEKFTKVVSQISKGLHSTAASAASLFGFLNRCKTLSDPVLRTKCLGNAIALLERVRIENSSGFVIELKERLINALKDIDDDWLKVDAGFELGSILADHDRPLAIQCVAEANAHRVALHVFEGSSSYLLCVRLAIRAFAGLMENAASTDEDFYRLEQLIQSSPSTRNIARFWGELAARAFAAEHSLGRVIVNDKLRPILRQLEEQNAAEWARLVVVLSPALYASHPISALEIIAKLPRDWIDYAYYEIILFILRRVSSFDPFDQSNEVYRVTFDQIEDICSLLSRIETDWMIYRTIKILVDSLTWKENRVTITAQHKAEIDKRLQNICDTKFPARRFIKHDGYKIITAAQLSRLRKHRENESICSAARTIPNLADRAIILGTIGDCLPSLDVSARRKLFEESNNLANQIPFLVDRIGRLRSLASDAKAHDAFFGRQCLREAFELVKFRNDRELSEACREIIDTAHNLSEDWASSLIDSIDDDPARKRAKQIAQRRLREIKLSEQLLDEDKAADEMAKDAGESLSGIAWRALGGLNAGRKKAVAVSHTRKYLELAARLPLRTAYPIMCWVIENNNHKLKGTEQVRTIIRGVFDAAVNSAELVSRMVLLKGRRTGSQSVSFGTFNPGNSVIRAGQRDKALNELQGWLGENIKESIRISDPYIGPDEAVQILQMVLSANPKCFVSILTSRKQQPKCQAGETLEEKYREQWRKMSDQSPPDCQIVIAGLKSSGEPTVHDRWWVAQDAGLRFGTSFSDIGVGKDSEICKMTLDEATDRGQLLDNHLQMRVREQKGDRVVYSTFTL